MIASLATVIEWVGGGINGGSVVDIGVGEDGISDEKEHILYPFVQR